jgi:hypothetical protein
MGDPDRARRDFQVTGGPFKPLLFQCEHKENPCPPRKVGNTETLQRYAKRKEAFCKGRGTCACGGNWISTVWAVSRVVAGPFRLTPEHRLPIKVLALLRADPLFKWNWDLDRPESLPDPNTPLQKGVPTSPTSPKSPLASPKRGKRAKRPTSPRSPTDLASPRVRRRRRGQRVSYEDQDTSGNDGSDSDYG